MSRSGSAMALLGAAFLVLLSVGGCTGRGPEASPPPPVASPPVQSGSPDLMGGPREPAPASEPPAASEPAFTSMGPVANPEDMSPEQRAQVYGDRYDRPLGHRRAVLARDRHPIHYYIGDGPRAADPRPGRHHHARPGWRHRGAYGERARHLGADAGAGARSARHALGVTKPAPPPPTGQSSAPMAAQATTAPPPTASPTAPQASSPGLDWLNISGSSYVDLPGIGHIPSRFITAGVLLVIAIALLAFAASRGQAAGARKRPARSSARNTVGAGPAFADERPAEPTPTHVAATEAPVAPFPHDPDGAPTPEAGR